MAAPTPVVDGSTLLRASLSTAVGFGVAVVAGMLSLRDLFTEIIDEQAETIDQLEHYIRGDQ